jgi:hypothetical protein
MYDTLITYSFGRKGIPRQRTFSSQVQSGILVTNIGYTGKYLLIGPCYDTYNRV